MRNDPSTEPRDHNLPVFTVSEISLALKRHVEAAFDRVRVKGEISGLKQAASGHVYFTLKDADAVLEAVCWRMAAQRLAVALENGLEVVANGRLTTYPGRSKYQIVVDAIELSGEGALLKLLDDRRKKLAAVGLFDPARKKRIPFLPAVIGVVTSPTGAVIRDILHRIADRFPRPVLLWPVLVQGQGAAEQIAAAIEGFNRLGPGDGVPRPDVLIVARGGGSLEDLWAFNEEIVVRAAAASAIPLISAVGHETDTTLIDFAADLRAPTPTAAAELSVPVRAELVAGVMGLAARGIAAVNRTLGERRTRLIAAERGLPQPARLLEQARQRLDDWSERFDNALVVGLDAKHRRLAQAAARLASPARRIEAERQRLAYEARGLDRAASQLVAARRSRLERAIALVESFSYQRVLERGFALVLDRGGHALTTVAATRPQMAVRLRFADGETGAVIDGTSPRLSPRGGGDGNQGSLF
jgi:exodeoxyribonuclease VII large subunit